MTFAQLLQYLADHTPYPILDGTPRETVEKAKSGSHRDPIAGGIVASLFERSGLPDVDAPIERAQAVSAIGPIRLHYIMKDDAPAEGFRMVEKIVHGIDGAFNDEALRSRTGD